MTLQEILGDLYGAFQWSFINSNGQGNLYSDLVWQDAAPKPTEAQILSRDAEATASRSLRLTKEGQARIFRSENVDAELRAFEIILNGVQAIYTALPTNVQNNVDPQARDAMAALRNRIIQIRAN